MQKIHVLLSQGLYVPSVKAANTYVIGLIRLSVLKTTKYARLYPATHYCTRLQGVKEKSFWSWSTTIFHYYNNLILIYDVPSSYRLYYVQFKEVKILWGLGAWDRIWGPGAGAGITQTPEIIELLSKVWNSFIASLILTY